jgi:uncharacterized protein (TIRG00374 family)
VGEGSGKKPASPHGRRLTVLRWALEVVVLAGGAVFVLRRLGHEDQMGAIFSRLHWHWLLLGVGAEAGSITALSWLQQRLLRVGGLPVGVSDLLPVTMASNAVAQSLPAGTLFAEGYAFRQYQRLGASRVLGFWAELSAGALAAAGLAGVALAGAVVVGPGLRLKLLPALSFVFAGALVAAFLFRRAPLLSRLIGRALRRAQRILPEKLCGYLASAGEATDGMKDFKPSTSLWVTCLLAAAFNWCLDAVVLTSGLLAVGVAVPWRGLLLSYAAAQLLVELPITPGGLGLVEGGLVELLTQFHVPASQATAATLVYRAVSYWMLLLTGWVAVAWLALHNKRAERAAGVPPDLERAASVPSK